MVTIVMPSGKADPLAGTLTRLVTVPQRSEAVTRKLTLIEVFPGSVVALIFAGQLIVGGWTSRTVTVKVHWLELPLASVAVLVTVVTPTGNVDPLTGTLTRLVTLPQVSLAVTVNVTLLVH